MKKYLILDSTEKYEEFLSEIKSEIETINGGEKMHYKKNYDRIAVNTDDDISFNKKIRFPLLIITIRCVFQNDRKLCPQMYLDECLYEL